MTVLTPVIGNDLSKDEQTQLLMRPAVLAGAEIEKIVDEVIANNPKNVEEFKAGKEKALNGLVGQVMKASKGKANPAQVNQLLRQKLA